jgi:hypothetical protein
MSEFKGTVDCTLIEEVDGVLKSVEIADYKDGMGVVDPYMNPQLMFYAGGVLVELKKKHGELPNVPVTLTIIQPKLSMMGKNPITSFQTDVATISQWMDDSKEKIELTKQPDAPVVPGESQCKWCAAKSKCPALVSKTLASIDGMFGDVTKSAASKDASDMTDAKIAELIEAAPLIRSFLDAVEDEALERIKSGKTIEGLKVIHSRGSKSWRLDDKATETRLRRMGVPKSEIYKVSIITPTQAQSLKWVTKTGEQKKLSDRQKQMLEGEYVEKKNGKLKVVLQSEKGDAVQFDASPLFNDNELPECFRGL